MTIEADVVINPTGQVKAEGAPPRLDEILWFRDLMNRSGSVDAASSRLTGDELRIAVNGGFELFALQIGGIFGSNRNGREGDGYQDEIGPIQIPPRSLAQRLRETASKIKDGIVNFCKFDPDRDNAEW